MNNKELKKQYEFVCNEYDYWKGIMVGFAISTIVWCLLWSFFVGKIDRVHKQELDYIIEKHQTK